MKRESDKPPYTIDDPIDLADLCSIEVTIDFPDGKRWLFFTTPKLLSTVGDHVDGHCARYHLGERHMIVVSEVTPTIIDAVLSRLHANGELYDRTLPFATD